LKLEPVFPTIQQNYVGLGLLALDVMMTVSLKRQDRFVCTAWLRMGFGFLLGVTFLFL